MQKVEENLQEIQQLQERGTAEDSGKSPSTQPDQYQRLCSRIGQLKADREKCREDEFPPVL